ncbi:MAG: T9SS type A sorting domain-containing protein, partial [Candidatus Cloacimonetes bacterium]|nr:T9SS type A sorting domain-containing protein [Candidatus Cloacimonadota bacterium]
DGTYHQMAVDEVPGYEDYLEHPIIFISVSLDNGETWSEPIELTDIYSTLFDFFDQITAYPYVCDHIVDLGDDWWQIYIYYLDDNSFGSFIHGSGQNNGGQITYCSIKIHPYWSVDPENPNTSIISLTNYPNPFATYTHISFSASKGIKNSSIKIYNTKGQLIRTLEASVGSTPSEGYAIWDGKDYNCNDVANGIYFYKLETNNGSVANKMLLTK